MENRYKYLDANKEHMHTLDGKPLFGTSSVTKIIAKPLTWWAAGMAVAKLGWINAKLRIKGKYVTTPLKERVAHAKSYFTKIKKMTGTEYIGLLDEAYRAHDERKLEAAKDGTDRHALLEEYVKLCMSKDGSPIATTGEGKYDSIADFITFAVGNIKSFIWSEANCYSEEYWTGGIADVGWYDKEDRIIAGDFKSSKEAYFDQFIQIAGYDIALTENGGYDKDGNKLFSLPGPIKGYCVIPFGMETLTPNFEYDVEAYKKGFQAALTLTKLQTTFNG